MKLTIKNWLSNLRWYNFKAIIAFFGSALSYMFYKDYPSLEIGSGICKKIIYFNAKLGTQMMLLFDT
ncbi:hypothetical protein VL14_04355 [Cytobacillus firmus]|nr:hypothetical protein VL14_04355 [Cytobacillus firmus]